MSLFFGLSGTGKTTLSADPRRRLIGDDEHCWSDDGHLQHRRGLLRQVHPPVGARRSREIFDAIRFGTVLENVVVDPATREVDYDDAALTENTRAAYPIEFIPNAKIPCVGGHPSNIIFLTCDAFGVLPPVSRLTPEQAMYHFISGYTAKVAGTEDGRDRAAGHVLGLLRRRVSGLAPDEVRRDAGRADARSTRRRPGWSTPAGRAAPMARGSASACAYTRAIIDAIHSRRAGRRADRATIRSSAWRCRGTCRACPTRSCGPRRPGPTRPRYRRAAEKLAALFHQNFRQYAGEASRRHPRRRPARCRASRRMNRVELAGELGDHEKRKTRRAARAVASRLPPRSTECAGDLHRRVAGLAGANAHALARSLTKILPSPTWPVRAELRMASITVWALRVGHDHFDLRLGNELDGVFRAAIGFHVPLLPAEAADVGHGHALHALGIQRVFDFFDLEMANDGFNLLHG